MSKLWEKGTPVNKLVESFTIGKDNELDLYLAEWDVIGTLAHTRMLESIGLLTRQELDSLVPELKKIHEAITRGEFSIEPGVEDIHSQVEILLTRALGETGKKVHSGRSRNDQVLVDIKLFTRYRITRLVNLANELFEQLINNSNQYKNILIPGYTHLQVAMPSSFGLWFGAYAESLTDDMLLLQSAYKIVNQNPLGSAAGYGSSFPLDRQMTTRLLGFDDLNYNVVYAQMGRGKAEKITAFAMASVAATLSRFAMDACLYMSQNFGFIKLPDEFTTGSSIMPHKKNPDVFELIRAKCNKLQSLPNELAMMLVNLPSGYFRDMQILKESFFPSFDELENCLRLATLMVSTMQVNTKVLEDEKYSYLFSVEELNKEVLQGMPFRDAYKKIGLDIEEGKFMPEKTVNHTHAGSIGNLCNEEISMKMQKTLQSFQFEKATLAIQELVGNTAH